MNEELKAAIARANKKHGPDTIILGSQLLDQKVARVTSGSLSLDVALGGGWPCNRWNEVYGDESSGKTLVAYKTIAANQEKGPFEVLWAAAEEFDAAYAQLCGCDLNQFYLIESNITEVVFEEVLNHVKQRLVDCVVIDSLPALVPSREDDKTMEDIQVGLQAFLNGKFLRKSYTATKRSLTRPDREVYAFVINQWREKIGGWGDPRITPGGRAKNYAMSTRVELKRDEWIEDGDGNRVGQSIKALVYKNKTASPQKIASFHFYFSDFGPIHAGSYDSLTELLAVGEVRGIVRKSGGWLYFATDKWHGRDAMVAQLREDLTLQEQISKEVYESLSTPSTVTPKPPIRRRKNGSPS